MTESERKINEIYDAIVGSELHPNGLLDRVDKLERFKEVVKKTGWTATGVLVAIGTILKFIK